MFLIQTEVGDIRVQLMKKNHFPETEVGDIQVQVMKKNHVPYRDGSGGHSRAGNGDEPFSL
jgi:hypothetical protein